ncbi:MAG: recombinase family protein, partial [Clostridiales bacterium]|nr:recombinase family protein [Clostridiales bacterium]
KIAKPRIRPEFVTFWLHKFRKLDVRQQSHRKMLIDAFVNAIYLYDDKLVLTFNYKDGTRTITLDDVKDAVKNNTGSDLDCRGAPKKRARQGSLFWCGRDSNPFNQQSSGLLVNAGWTAFTP